MLIAFHRLIAKSILEAESYMPKVVITSTIEKQLNDINSRFHSQKYTVSTSNTGVVEEIARLYDIEKSTPTQPIQPPLDDDDGNTDHYTQIDDNKSSSSHSSFIQLYIVILIIGGIIVWIKFPHLLRRDRGTKFIPVSSRDEEA
jgi:hypothetical protein